jgi:deoxyribodipyrimidine photolyase-related protein
MTQKRAALVYPHQLWEQNPAVAAADTVFLVEDPLFFAQYRFHAQKLVLHRASMTEYSTLCEQMGKQVIRVESKSLVHSSDIADILKGQKIKVTVVVEPTDEWLRKGIEGGCRKSNIQVEWLEDPSFLTPTDVMQRWAEPRKHFHFTDFYMQQRKRLSLLLDASGKPLGGKWTFDTDNRKKLPKNLVIPKLKLPKEGPSVDEAKRYVAKNFPHALGQSDDFLYPVTHQDAAKWLSAFVDQRLESFGDYEDAISQKEPFVFHSLLTPTLNIGLITPTQIIDSVVDRSDATPMNSLEGFIRQVIGWREFIRLVYIHAGARQRTTNYWELTNCIPASFYDGSTGIVPLDESIKRTLKYAYCHHIERLMVLGNFMLLTDIAPDAVYRWFMELFIDAYDWVMVPNVYGMSQHADGGLMTTKPYISGSSYILKMSDYSKGDWCPVWDALYWRFIDRHREFFKRNPRMSVMVGQLDRMGTKLKQHHMVADQFLEKLHG